MPTPNSPTPRSCHALIHLNGTGKWPILIVYPFAQKSFTKSVLTGAIKG